MNYLTALLAFSAIMIVLATLTTVVVEAIHGATKRRARDFEEMLQKLYDDAVVPRLGEGVEKAKSFAQEMTRNPAFDDNKFKFFTTAFNKLTTRQFVEQFAHTDAGKRLQAEASRRLAEARSKLADNDEKQRAEGRILLAEGEEAVREVIAALAYQFERYGEAASDYFKRRARTLSVLAAFVMALALNVDAIELFTALAADKSMTENVLTQLNVDELEKTYKESIAAGKDKAAIDESWEAVRSRIRADSQQLSGLGIPIGLDYFPYCVGKNSPVEATKNKQDSNDTQTDNKQQQATTTKDTRCENVATFVAPEGKKCGDICVWLGRARTVLSRVFGSSEGIAWLISALMAGGLIGLGAPFWFKAYSFVASFVPGLKTSDGAQARQSRGAATAQPAAAGAGAAAVTTAGGLTDAELAEAFVKSKQTG